MKGAKKAWGDSITYSLKEAAKSKLVKPKSGDPSGAGADDKAERDQLLTEYNQFLKDKQLESLKTSSTKTLRLNELFQELKNTFQAHSLNTPAGGVETIPDGSGSEGDEDADNTIFFEPDNIKKRKPHEDHDDPILAMLKQDSQAMLPFFKALAPHAGSAMFVSAAVDFASRDEWLAQVFLGKEASLPALVAALDEHCVTTENDIRSMTQEDIKVVCQNKSGLVNLLKNAIATLNGEVSAPPAAKRKAEQSPNGEGGKVKKPKKQRVTPRQKEQKVKKEEYKDSEDSDE